MGALGAAAIVWIAVHLGIAGTVVRRSIVARLGQAGFRTAFSIVSVISLILLILSYNAAPVRPIWFAPDWLRWVLAFVMLIAATLFVASVASPNPTAAGGERAIEQTPRGITRVTRHPMLWAFAIWAAVHVLGNGDLASVLFFGAFLITALAGMPSIDANIAARDPVRWAPLAAATSIVPGAAIAGGRNRFAPREIGWIVWAGGLLLWLVLLFGHRYVVGVSPVSS